MTEHADQRQRALRQRRDRHHDVPSAAAWELIDHQLPGLALSWNASESRWACCEQVAAEVEHHPLVDPGVDVAVEHRQSVAHEGDQE